jgi:hypothetical protein
VDLADSDVVEVLNEIIPFDYEFSIDLLLGSCNQVVSPGIIDLHLPLIVLEKNLLLDNTNNTSEYMCAALISIFMTPNSRCKIVTVPALFVPVHIT